jgi:hypothetical protein
VKTDPEMPLSHDLDPCGIAPEVPPAERWDAIAGDGISAALGLFTSALVAVALWPSWQSRQHLVGVSVAMLLALLSGTVCLVLLAACLRACVRPARQCAFDGMDSETEGSISLSTALPIDVTEERR